MKSASSTQEVCGAIAELNYDGEVHAIAAVILRKNGDVQTLLGFNPGTGLPLLGGIAVLQSCLIGTLVPRLEDDT